jgi:dienelactone hydrolase
MTTTELLNRKNPGKALIVFIVCLVVLIAAEVTASLTQRDFGRVEVSNVTYQNYNGIPIRAKLLRPVDATADSPMPGVVYIHGYQNNRETGDAYSLEIARRGFVVLNIDAIGRGNSGIPDDPDQPDFDETYGGTRSIAYLRSLAYVDTERVGILGHSLGAEIAYHAALDDPTIKALVITGFAYGLDASETKPKNMLMIIGKWDEFRDRMTGTRDIEAEWMSTERTRQVFPVDNPELEVTYGSPAEGTARRVFILRVTHVQESHNHAAIAETVEWLKLCLQPPTDQWIDANRQIWPLKEYATLIAMLACFASLMPLSLMLIRTEFFSPLKGPVVGEYTVTPKTYRRGVIINGVLMWLYIPLILIIFGLHMYVIPIDGIFPMMMVNGVIWWFLWVNVIGFFIFQGWFKKQARENGLTLLDLGISFGAEGLTLDQQKILKTLLLGVILFGFAYLAQYVLEQIFIVDFRFIWPFASDLTPYRWLMFLLYLPFILIGFLLTGVFIHGQLRRRERDTWGKTFLNWSASNLFALIAPLILFLMVQYVPLFTTGFIPFVGPGGVFVVFILLLFHVIMVLIIATLISTWCYQITGKIYLGVVVNALIVAWMFASSQVIAPIPV